MEFTYIVALVKAKFLCLDLSRKPKTNVGIGIGTAKIITKTKGSVTEIANCCLFQAKLPTATAQEALNEAIDNRD